MRRLAAGTFGLHCRGGTSCTWPRLRSTANWKAEMTLSLENSPRLVTVHNTVLYFERDNEVLRHGPRNDSPANVRLAFDGSRARLIFVREGRLVPIVARSGAL